MNKLKVVLAGLYYPFAMLSYYRRALERRNDIELYTVGAFTGQQIPWANGLTISNKYMNQVDLPLPQNVIHPTWESVAHHLPWEPDLVLTIDAGWSFANKPKPLSAHVGTDPHVLNYDHARQVSDKFFNMQSEYMKGGDVLLPYAFDKDCHYPEHIEKDLDACLIGLHYPQRNEWVQKLRDKGLKVHYSIGEIYDEYRYINSRSFIGLNWSSLNDVTARVFEICAMKLVPVFNRLPALDALGFEEGRHYLGFSTMEEAVERVMWAKNNREFAEQIALNAYLFVHENGHDWDHRVQKLLETMGLV